MTEHPSNRQPLSPLEQLDNITDALFADELLETEFEAEDADRADAVIRAAIAQASAAPPGSVPPALPQMPFATNIPAAGSIPDADGMTPALESSQEPATETKDQRWQRWSSEPHARPTESRPSSRTSPDAHPHGFAQMVAIHPGAAFLLSAINLLLTITGWGTVGLGFIFETPLVLPIAWFIAFTAQKRWPGDNLLRVYIKTFIMTFLTALPIPLAPFILIPAGIVGLRHRKTTKATETTETKVK